MFSSILLTLLCGLAIGHAWDFPGYPGDDCPTTREKVKSLLYQGRMLPECNENGTFQELQCFYQHLSRPVPDSCMCAALDGSHITLPGMGLNVQTCVYYTYGHNLFVADPNAEMPRCEDSGFFKPLQCSRSSGKCWCVDKYGSILAPPSTEIKSCGT